MMRRRSFGRDRSGSAAVEMALVTPLLLIILFGSVEVGNYFYNEHLLVKAVRDGARFAARQNFSYYESGGSCSSPTDAMLITDIKTLVMTSLLSGGTNRLPTWNTSTITISAACQTVTGGQTMTGIYRGRTGGTAGAPIVTVTASVPYTPIMKSLFGFSGIGVNLNAAQQAAVTGL